MVTKHYPPQIEGTIPAFYIGETLTVPFKMNQTVGWNDIDGFCIKIKNIQNNELIATLTTLSRKDGVVVSNHDSGCAYFDTASLIGSTPKIQKGMFYKIQMCYINAPEDSLTPNNYGYYSTVGVVKCTSRPIVKIQELESKKTEIQDNNHIYTGYYSQKNIETGTVLDSSEKIYSYNFTVYDDQDEIFETSGELLHNHENNENPYEAIDKYTLIKTLDENKVYGIVYSVTTANGAIAKTEKYLIQAQGSIPPAIKATLIATMNEENGYVHLQLIGDKDNKGYETPGTGNFIICRASSKDGYSTWYEMDRLALSNELPSTYDWKDFTIEHGYSYVYSLQQYKTENSNICSTRLTSNEIEAKFEHCFLYDGKRQLKIKYNPKIGAIKETLLESKTNTMGGKYPVFFKNGNVAYKEFSISGLVSYHTDEEELFLTDEEMYLDDISQFVRKYTLKDDITSNDWEYFNNINNATTSYILQELYANREYPTSQENTIGNARFRSSNLTDYNVLAERIFKNKVLEFLNDEQPKLFRSPGEGSCIVRLMNSSLAPDDKLNRMIHTFSTTATEIDDCNHEKMNKYGLLSTNKEEIKLLQTKTINVADYKDVETFQLGENNSVLALSCTNMNSEGDRIIVEYSNTDRDTIYIGPTGELQLEFDEAPLSIKVKSISKQGNITFKFYGSGTKTIFDEYNSIVKIDTPVIQIKGNNLNKNKNIKDNLEDIKHKVLGYYFIQFSKDPNSEEDALYKFWIDGKEYNIGNQVLEINTFKHIPDIKISGGVLVNVSVRYREIKFEGEESINGKSAYESAKANVLDHIKNFSNTNSYTRELENKIAICNREYASFILNLENSLRQKGVL